jgi:PhzF family phenazine biosynthesis protein
MSMKIYQVDSFTDKPFAGNPAGVCLMTEQRDANWMLAVAREMNVAETAFLQKAEDGYQLRWFSPEVEIDLCGHATLASAHILWQEGELKKNVEARFHTKSGLLTAQLLAEEWIQLNFPATPPAPSPAPEKLNEILGAAAIYVGRSKFDLLVEVDSENTVRSLKPDFDALRNLDVRGVIVTARATTKPFDFVSRFFGPAVGINEDPATGSSHCCLAPYWSGKLNKDSLLAYQCSSRSGVLRVRNEGERVLLEGKATTVIKGELLA